MGSILLVEADPDTIDRWSRALETAGHDAVATHSMRDALPSIHEGGIDLVVIDFDTCPGVIELARAIDLLPDAPPIVLVSGSPAAPEVSVRIGAAQFIAKPCEPSEIVAVVSRQLAPSRSAHKLELNDDEPTILRTRLGELG